MNDPVYNYLKNNRYSFSNTNLFHYSTRLAAWNNTDYALTDLRKLKPLFVPDDIYASLINIKKTEISTKNRLYPPREKFFAKYPELFYIDLLTTRARHLKYVYGIDISYDLFRIYDKTFLNSLKDKILLDKECIKFLSTYAITVCYMICEILDQPTDQINLDEIIEIGRTYNLEDPLEIRLYIYLFTHCIIYESNFYTETISNEKRLESFKKMLRTLDSLICKNFNLINLDNKLEFLVCCRICDFKSDIESRIYDECRKSIKSESEVFLVDKYNENKDYCNTDFNSSEHRNILYILSLNKFKPNKTLIN